MVANLLPLLPKSFLNKTDKDGKTPLHYAATNSFFLHFQKSSKKSAEIENSRNGVFENEQQSAAICDIFLQNGASVEIRDKNVIKKKSLRWFQFGFFLEFWKNLILENLIIKNSLRWFQFSNFFRTFRLSTARRRRTTILHSKFFTNKIIKSQMFHF